MKYLYFVVYWYAIGVQTSIGNGWFKTKFNLDDYEESKIGIDDLRDSLMASLGADKVVITDWKSYNTDK